MHENLKNAFILNHAEQQAQTGNSQLQQEMENVFKHYAIPTEGTSREEAEEQCRSTMTVISRALTWGPERPNAVNLLPHLEYHDAEDEPSGRPYQQPTTATKLTMQQIKTCVAGFLT